jgi:hypothetical protein
MPPSTRPERIILGQGPVAGVLAQLIAATQVPDEWLIRQTYPHSTFSGPLIQCQHVFQVTTDVESPARERWRHDAFWRLYGKLGGDIAAPPGLRWVFVDCRNHGNGMESVPSKFVLRVSAACGLREILAACGLAKPNSYTAWNDAFFRDKEVEIRRKIIRLILKGERIAETAARVRELATALSPLAWERFCPPPDDHALANRLRTWLRSPVTDSVTPWFVNGETLLRQTSLTP